MFGIQCVMKNRILPFVLFLLLHNTGWSCLNTFHALDKEGHFHDLGLDKFVGFNTNFNPRLMKPKFAKLEADIREKKSPYLLSDYAVLLLKAGKTQESLDLLISLNSNLPNEYKIAANLGTAYEIAGNLDSALHYIKRGVELNPNAHEGSEWVHIRILETKLGLIDNPNLLRNRTVLQLSEVDEKDIATRQQLEIQIRERFPFSPEGDDPIMASLLIDLGDCYVETATYEHANAFYTIAQKYYGAPEMEVKHKIKRTVTLRSEHKHINVPDLNNEGMETKVEAIRYRSILDDNNDPPFTIDWTNINLNVDELLAMVDMKMVFVEEQIIDSSGVLELVEDKSSERVEDNVDKETFINWKIIGGSAVVAIGLLFYLLMRKRRKVS